MTAMQTAHVNNTTIEFDVQGTSGDPVLLIHGSIFADGMSPLLRQESLANYRLIHYNRRGYGASTSAVGRRCTIAHQAADAEALLDYLDIPRCHVVGHSYGAAIALQLATQTPRMAQSVTLLEPPLLAAAGGADVNEGLAGLIQRYCTGDKLGALQQFMTNTAGEDWEEKVSATMGPKALQQALEECESFFEVELPALRQWRFDSETAYRVLAPALSIMGDDTTPFMQSSHESLVRWIPGCMQMVVFGTNHLLPLSPPKRVAQGVARFLSRHPMPVAIAAAIS